MGIRQGCYVCVKMRYGECREPFILTLPLARRARRADESHVDTCAVVHVSPKWFGEDVG